MLKFFRSLNRRVGLDLGTERSRLWLQGEGLVVDVPSLVALNQDEAKVIAVGEEAAKMRGRVAQPLEVISLFERGSLVDDELLANFLKILLNRAAKKASFFNPDMMIAMPSSVTLVKKQAVVRVLYQVGAREVLIINQGLAAAIGAGVPIADASACFLLQLGAGVSETTVISLGKVVDTQTNYHAGQRLAREISYWLKKNKQLVVSDSEAERVARNISSLNPDRQYKLEVGGIDLSKRTPKEESVNSQEIRPVVEEVVANQIQSVKALLSRIAPDLTVDVVDKGLLLSGGLAQTDQLCEYLSAALRVPVSLVDEPDLAVIRGVGTVLDHLNEFKQSLAYE